MTTRGTQDNRPEEVEIQRKRVTDEGLKLDLLIRWDIHEITVEDEMSGETHNEWEYEQETVSDTYEGRLADLGNYISNKTEYYQLQAKEKASDLTSEEEKELIDYRTGQAIDERIHSASGVEEQVGILRYAITELYNRLGETAPTELQDLNTIANEEIQNGQDLKSEV